MAEHKKFIFNNDFSNSKESLDRAHEEKIIRAKSLLSSELEQSKKQAYDEGFAKGQQQALDTLRSEMDKNINNMLDNMTQIHSLKQELHTIFEEQSTASVSHIISKLYFESEKLFKKEILEQSVVNGLKNMPYSTKIKIRIPQATAHYITDTQVEQKLKDAGFTDFEFVTDQNLKLTESIIEWDKSGILSSKEDAFKQITNTIDHFLSPEDKALSKDNLEIVKEVAPEKTEDINTKAEVSDDISVDTAIENMNLEVETTTAETPQDTV